MEILIFLLIVWSVFGLVCYKMAEKRGRNAWLGFGLGFVFGLFAIIGYAIAGETSERKAEIMATAIKRANGDVA